MAWKYGLITLVLFCCFACWRCTNGDGGDGKKYDDLDQRTRIRLKQYMREGKRLYLLHCSNCHQEEGTGLAQLYPPLKDSDYLISNPKEVICGMRNGQQGPLVVNGITFNQPMPENRTLTDLEIAEIATYVYNEFADSVTIITINEVRQFFRECGQDPV